ncbi:GNAT family N-acetyltransferase [Haloglycomyces albus]|uniref:GNAT family N-acetyltransferase n=1 Tax=Haloglycomyces albus TaxID=526067 RepID=UPI00046CA919|nr:GNAT family N-acetyltransferase [Haloglycomyces albus]
MTNTSVYESVDPQLGEMALRPIDPVADAELLSSWLRDPKSKYWMAQNATAESVRHEYESMRSDPYAEALMGLHRGAPRFFIEVYEPSQSELSGRYEHREGDIGMHVLTAPTRQRLQGFTRAVMRVTMEYLFDAQGARRVVVEPDVDNTAIHRLNSWVGFKPDTELRLNDKVALLSFCTKANFQASEAKERG